MRSFNLILLLFVGLVALTKARRCPAPDCPDELQPVCATLRNGRQKDFMSRCHYLAAKRCEPYKYSRATFGNCNGRYAIGEDDNPILRAISIFQEVVEKFQRAVHEFLSSKLNINLPTGRRDDDFDEEES